MKLFWRRRAEQQLRAQLQFLEDVNPRAAKRMRMRIRERLTRLKRAPLTGRPSRAEGVRELIIAGTPYVAVYEAQTPSRSSASSTLARTVPALETRKSRAL
jgi:toxin ParE1/3/4